MQTRVLFPLQRLANQGIYPGVEYRILEVSIFPMIPGSPATSTAAAAAAAAAAGSEPPYPSSFEQQQEQQEQQEQRADLDAEPSSLLASARDAPEGSFEDGGLVFTMRPIYPLVKRLERDDWPVLVPAREFPVMLTPFSYNAATAWAALTTSLSLLAVGFVASQALTFSVINSHSMEPTLQVGMGVGVRAGLGVGGAAAQAILYHRRRFRINGRESDHAIVGAGRLVKDVWMTLR